MTALIFRLARTELSRIARRWGWWCGLIAAGAVAVVVQSANNDSGTVVSGHVTGIAYLFSATWDGPHLHASVMSVLFWMITPLLFLLVLGEPWSIFLTPWHHFIWSRSKSRFCAWLSQVIALYSYGFIGAVLLVIAGLGTASVLGAGVAPLSQVGTHSLEWSSVLLTLLTLITMMWGYTGILVALSAVIRRPGWVTTITILIGYIWTTLEVSYPAYTFWGPPINGGFLDMLAIGHNASNFILYLVGKMVVYTILAFAISYGNYRRHML